MGKFLASKGIFCFHLLGRIEYFYCYKKINNGREILAVPTLKQLLLLLLQQGRQLQNNKTKNKQKKSPLGAA